MKRLALLLLLSSCACAGVKVKFADDSEQTAQVWACLKKGGEVVCIDYKLFDQMLQKKRMEMQLEPSEEVHEL